MNFLKVIRYKFVNNSWSLTSFQVFIYKINTYNKYAWKFYWNKKYEQYKNKYYFIKHCNNKKEFNLKTKSSTIS